MSQNLDTSEDHSVVTPALHWPQIRQWLETNSQHLVEDRELLQQIGLKSDAHNVVDFGRAAISKMEANAQREAGARRLIEEISRTNFASQTQTHVAALDLMEATNLIDLSRQLDISTQARFGLAGAAVAIEKPGTIPFGWKALEPGRVDALLGADGRNWLGPNFTGLDLFGPADGEVRSVALVRMNVRFEGTQEGRPAICAFGSTEDEGFTPAMGGELIAFVARVFERMAERWPLQEI